MGEMEYIDRANDRVLNKFRSDLQEYENNENIQLEPFSATLESLLSSSTKDEIKELFGQEVSSSVTNIVHAGYSCLNLIHFFTYGPEETRCWTIQRGTLAPQAAAVIHSDFEKGFVSVEVCSFPDFVGCGGTEAAVKAANLCRTLGKTYVVEDGDIVNFKINQSALTKNKK